MGLVCQWLVLVARNVFTVLQLHKLCTACQALSIGTAYWHLLLYNPTHRMQPLYEVAVTLGINYLFFMSFGTHRHPIYMYRNLMERRAQLVSIIRALESQETVEDAN